MLSSTASLLLIGSHFKVIASEATRVLPRDGSSPSLPYDDNTSKYCSWWVDINSATSCPSLLDDNYINLEEFRRWNPSITADCGNLLVGKSYCVETMNEPAPDPIPSSSSSAQSSTVFTSSTLTTSTTLKPAVTSSSSKSIPSSTSTPPPTTTSAGNGVATPQPTQPGMVTNCNKFHWIAKGVVCSQVISYQKISLADFVKWNPTVKDDCSGMWAEVNVCVGIIGGTTPTPTTSAGNGVQTPQPIQSGMVTNCKKFHYVAEGVVCSQITSFNKISLADFVKWNSGVGSDCKSMWAGTNVCVGV